MDPTYFSLGLSLIQQAFLPKYFSQVSLQAFLFSSNPRINGGKGIYTQRKSHKGIGGQMGVFDCQRNQETFLLWNMTEDDGCITATPGHRLSVAPICRSQRKIAHKRQGQTWLHLLCGKDFTRNGNERTIGERVLRRKTPNPLF